jgi:hypothetical protein
MPESQYKPGYCNIGRRELSVRKKLFSFCFVVTLAFSVLGLIYSQSYIWWILLLLSAFTLFVLYLEIRYRFCIFFGFFNFYNFGNLGNLEDVKDKEDGNKDKKRTASILIKALLLSLAFTAVLRMLATQFH